MTSAEGLRIAGMLSVENLTIRNGAGFAVLRGVDLTVGSAEVVGLSGESGSGKSMLARAVIQLLPPGFVRSSGTIRLADAEITSLTREELRSVRGQRIGMVFQDPAATLNPVFTIGQQIEEAIRAHERLSRAALRTRVHDLLSRVQLPDPDETRDLHPHQLSGGMKQRAVIALALASAPEVLLADEPTSAVDASLQGELLELIVNLARERKMGVLLISHDLGALRSVADRVHVMYAGQIVELGETRSVLLASRHPYTAALMRCRPPGVRGRALPTIEGQAPAVDARPGGCSFHPRCPRAEARCQDEEPQLSDGAHRVRCFFPIEGSES